MANNDYINKVEYGGDTLIDLTSDTVTADTLVEGYTAHTRSGASITGTLSDATQSAHGLMSATDKTKLDNIDEITKTISNQSIASFSDSADNVMIPSLYIRLDATQSGSGDPSPSNNRPIIGWNHCNVVRSGKNLLDINRPLGTPMPASVSNETSPRVMEVYYYYKGSREDNYYVPEYISNVSISGNTLSVTGGNANNMYGAGFPVIVKGGQKYTLSFVSENAMVSFSFYDKEWKYIGHTDAIYTSGATITAPTNATYMNVIFRAANETTYTYSNIQLELGETATAYEEPDVAVLSRIDIPAYGKNLFDVNNPYNVIGAYLSTTTISSASTVAKTICIPCEPNTKYIISKTAGQRFSVAYTNEAIEYNGNVLGFIANHTGTNIAIQTGPQAKYLLAYVYHSSYDTGVTAAQMLSSVQIEKSNSLTSYEPYISAGYNSTIDVVNGFLVAEYGVVNLWELDFYYTSPGFFVYDYSSASSSVFNCDDSTSLVCSCYKTVNYSAWTSMEDLTIMCHPTIGTIFRIKDTNYSDVATFKAALKAVNAQLMYKLSAPITYALPEQRHLTTKIGLNQIWADAGDIFYLIYYLDKPINHILDGYLEKASTLKSGLMSASDKQKLDDIAIATTRNLGLVKPMGMGVAVNPTNGEMYINKGSSAAIKAGSDNYAPLVASNQHEATFYGLAKAAGDTTQYLSSNAVGTYTDDAKNAIRTMLGTPSTAAATTVVSGLMSANDKWRLNLMYDNGTNACSIFKKVCCIGDSLMSGYISGPYDSSAVQSSHYSWVDYMPILTGGEYINLGISGATIANWLTSNDGLAKAQLTANKAQAYLIGLGVNDYLAGTTIGTPSDMSQIKNTFCSAFGYLIQSINTINSSAHVFVMLPPVDEFDDYRQALIDCIEVIDTNVWQYHVHILDLNAYYDLFERAGCFDSISNDHFTEVGYAKVAEAIIYVWNQVLSNEPLKFSDVHLSNVITTKFATEAYVQNAISGSGSLPAVTSTDNGKVLRVVNGAWSAVSLPSASGVSF